jgi:hypothetical protein
MWTPDNLTSVVPVNTDGWPSSPWFNGDPNCSNNDEACLVLVPRDSIYYFIDAFCTITQYCPLCEIDEQ